MVEIRADQEKVYVSYADYGILLTRLVEKITESQKIYTGIYGIPRGGLPIAVHLSHHLNLPLLTSPTTGCLLVDDISDSGETLKKILSQVTVDIATMYFKKESIVKPTYFLEVIEQQTWIVFPWEL